MNTSGSDGPRHSLAAAPHTIAYMSVGTHQNISQMQTKTKSAAVSKAEPPGWSKHENTYSLEPRLSHQAEPIGIFVFSGIKQACYSIMFLMFPLLRKALGKLGRNRENQGWSKFISVCPGCSLVSLVNKGHGKASGNKEKQRNNDEVYRRFLLFFVGFPFSKRTRLIGVFSSEPLRLRPLQT